MRAIVLFFLISGMLTACGDNNNIDKNTIEAKDTLQVISTIKPIQAIVLAIAGKHIHSEQLIPENASPHDYSFKPSDIRKVKNADIIFRIDEHMESQLNAVFENINTTDDSDKRTTIISLAEIEGISLLETGHLHQKEDSNKQNHDGHNAHENIDFHIWTSPKNAIFIANEVTRSLSKLDSKNVKYYQQNFENFSQLVKDESEEISVRLAQFKSKPYIVFHDSWQYFANEFGLHKPIVVDLHEGVSSGARTISAIRTKIEKQNIQCIFYDSSVSEARLKILSQKVNTIAIDVLAKGMKMNQTTYVNWLKRLGKQVETCLSD